MAAGPYSQRVAGEDDYDDDEPAAQAPAQQLHAQPRQQQPAVAPLQLPVGMAAAGTAPTPAQQLQALQHQLQQQQAARLQLHPLQLQQLQQLQQQAAAYAQQAAVAGLPFAPAATAAAAAQQQQPQQPQQVRRVQLTPEQERLRQLNMATPEQEARQEELSFFYLDLDELGEDIVHFSELFGFTDNMIKVRQASAVAAATSVAAQACLV